VTLKSISGATRVFGLIGHPVKHSLSPQLYNTLFERSGIDAVYLAFDVAPEKANQVSDIIRTLGLEGVNLTVPFKESIYDDMDSLGSMAALCGALNVVTHKAGHLMGHNTDGEGFINSLVDDDGPNIDGVSAIVLGAGGAARAIALSLLSHGAKRIHLLNRTISRAETLAADLSEHHQNAEIFAHPLLPSSFAASARESELVVNCTSGAAQTKVQRLDPTHLAAHASWVDINYWMSAPPCEDRCRDARVRFHDGLGMLAHQGALAFKLFTGQSVDGRDVKAILSSSP
jgi:shikimate dehydrogenase